MWQQLIVFAIVAVAAIQLGVKYFPLSWRRQMVYGLSRCGAPQQRLAAWLKTTPGCGDGCSSCGACRSEPAAATTTEHVIKLHSRP